MNAQQYTVAAYAIAAALLWGYAIRLWLAGRTRGRREQDITENGERL